MRSVIAHTRSACNKQSQISFWKTCLLNEPKCCLELWTCREEKKDNVLVEGAKRVRCCNVAQVILPGPARMVRRERKDPLPGKTRECFCALSARENCKLVHLARWPLAAPHSTGSHKRPVVHSKGAAFRRPNLRIPQRVSEAPTDMFALQCDGRRYPPTMQAR